MNQVFGDISIPCRLYFGAALVLTAGIADAEERMWNSTTGGVFTAAENWTPEGVPGADDHFYFTKQQSAPITLATSLEVGANYTGTWQFFDGTPFDGELRFDKDATLTYAGTGNLYMRATDGGSPNLRLTSGTVRISQASVLIADAGYHDGVFSVTGPDAKFISEKILQFRGVGTNWCFKATNGGQIESSFYLGYTGANDAHLLVSGEGSSWTVPASATESAYVGRHGRGSTLTVESGGTFMSYKDIFIGGSYTRGQGEARGGNRIDLATEGTFVVNGSLAVGHDTSSNAFTVASGAHAFVTGDLTVGYKMYSWPVNYAYTNYPYANEVYVSGEGSLLSVTGDVYVSRTHGYGSRLSVSNGAKIDVNVGGTAAQDGIFVGENSNYKGFGNEISVSGGAVLTSPWIYLFGRGNTLTVDDAQLVLSEGLRAGNGLGDDVIVIRGKTAAVQASRTILNRNTTLDIEVPPEGFDQPLFTARSYFSFNAESSGTKTVVRVKLHKDLSEKKTFTLFNSTTGSNIENLENIEWDLPHGSSIDVSDKKQVRVTVKPPRPFVISVR